LEHTALEETLSDALLAAGEQLAEAMRIGLSAQGLPSELTVLVEGERVLIASRSGAVRDAEVGTVSRPPTAMMESMAREASAALVHAISAKLRAAGLD